MTPRQLIRYRERRRIRKARIYRRQELFSRASATRIALGKQIEAVGMVLGWSSMFLATLRSADDAIKDLVNEATLGDGK